MDTVEDRYAGRSNNGFVNIRSFDRGIIETLGAVLDEQRQEYFIPISAVGPEVWQENKDEFRDRVDPREGLPGIPVTFSFPEDVLKKMYIPMVLIRRDDISPAMNRWHPGMLQFRGPALGAQKFQYKAYPYSTPTEGWNAVSERQQALPCDISYTIQVVARNRGAYGIQNQANRLLDYVLRIYPFYSRVLVKDSVGDLRSYEAYMEAMSPLDDAAEIADRMIGYAFTLRVEGELDHLNTEDHLTVRSKTLGITRR